MHKVFLQKIKDNLLSQKNDLLKRSDKSKDIDTDGDETDEIQANLIIEIESQLNSRNSFKLKQIEDALSRIEKETYGLCDGCEEHIPEKRLLANPHFLTCVNCAEEREKEEKQRKRL